MVRSWCADLVRAVKELFSEAAVQALACADQARVEAVLRARDDDEHGSRGSKPRRSQRVVSQRPVSPSSCRRALGSRDRAITFICVLCRPISSVVRAQVLWENH